MTKINYLNLEKLFSFGDKLKLWVLWDGRGNAISSFLTLSSGVWGVVQGFGLARNKSYYSPKIYLSILNVGVGRWDMRNFKKVEGRLDMQHFEWFGNIKMIKVSIIVPRRLIIWLKRLRCYLDNEVCVD